MLLDILLLVVSALLLWFGAEWIVDSASDLARRWGMSELVVGLTVVAMGTSAPEFLVTATAAFKGMNDISLSNVVGSNIFNLGFILGLMALIKPLPTNRTILYRDGALLFAVTALILILGYFMGTIGRISGIFLTSSLTVYIIYLVMRGSKSLPVTSIPEPEQPRRPVWVESLRLLAGFTAISLGGHLMVESATSMALALGVSTWVIGMTIVAAGTSLPELVTCLAASVRGKNEMLLGNLIGSDFYNFAGVLGLTCLLKPLGVTSEAMPGLVMLVAMVGIVLVMMRSGWRVGRLEGAILIGLSLARWVRDFI